MKKFEKTTLFEKNWAKLYNFLGKLKLSTTKKLKSPKPQRFHPKQFDNISREIKVEFLDKKMKNSNSVQKSKFGYLHP